MNILFVGCGNMGSAIVSGMLDSKKFTSNEITALLPEENNDAKELVSKFNISIIHELVSNNDVDVLIFAVKPQILDEIMSEYAGKISPNALIISICAGKTVSYFEKHFPHNNIVRTMPNLNSMIQKGSTVGIANNKLPENHKNIVESIFESVGSYTWLDDEDLVDIVASISGSGPAYFFLFTELLAKAGIKHGLGEDLANKLAIETFIGAAATLEQSGELPSDLREAVTSKGGTTAAALGVFNDSDVLGELIKSATKEAVAKAKILSK